MVSALLYDILDIAAECSDRRTRRWLAVAALLLVSGNLSFFWMLGAASNGHWTVAAVALLTTLILLLGTGTSLAAALATAVQAKRGALPSRWGWLACAIVIAIVIVPPPVVLAAGVVFGIMILAKPWASGLVQTPVGRGRWQEMQENRSARIGGSASALAATVRR